MGIMNCNSIKRGVVILLAMAAIVFGHVPARAGFADVSLNSASGALTLSRTDLTLGKIFPIAIMRQYNSKSGFVGPLGHGWALAYDKQLYVYSNGSVIIRSGPGKKSTFTPSGSGFLSPLADAGILTRAGDGTYTYIAQDGRRENYDAHGRLAGIIDPKGNSLALTYESTTKSPLTGLLSWNIDQTTPTVVAYVYHLSRIEEKNAAGTATGKWISFSYDPATGMLTGLSDNLGRIITFGHDTIGNLTSVTGPGVAAIYGYTDPNQKHLLTSVSDGHGTFVTSYDTSGRVIRQTHGNTTIAVAYTIPRVSSTITTTVKDASGTVISTETRTVVFDSQRQIISETDTLGNQIKYTRNSQTWVTRKEWWQNTGTVSAPHLIIDHAVDFTYDAKGNTLTKVEPNGTTTYTYDANGNMLTETNPLNQTTTYTYNGANQILTSSGPKGIITNTYDTSGNILTTSDPAGGTTRYDYDARGNIGTTTNALDKVTTYTYDANDNQASVTDPAGVKTSYTYDVNGNMLTQTDPAGKTTTYSYDTLNRLVKVTDPFNHDTAYIFDANGNRSAVTDANNNTTTYSYNDLGQVTAVRDPLGNVTTYTYGGAGGTGCTSCGGSSTGGSNLVALTDAKGQTTSYQYDFLDRVTQETDPLQKMTTHRYDAAGNRVAKTDANGSNLGYSYDPLNRLTGITYPDSSTVSYTYDDAGRIHTAANSNITYTYGYDTGNRVTSITDSRGYTLAYEYDTIGNRTTTTLQPGTLEQHIANYTYDNASRMSTITSPAGAFTYGYDTLGRRAGLVYPNQVTATYSYDDASRLTGISHTSGTTTIAFTDYPAFDNIGNRMSKITDSGTEQYSYDAIYRLTQAITPNGTENFSYDAVGNRLIGPGPKDTSYLYNAGNQMTKGRQFSYSFDNNGNQAARSIPSATDKSWNLTWDYKNRLTKMEQSKGTTEKRTITFKYDSQGRRIEKKLTTIIDGVTKNSTWTYVYDYDNIALEIYTDPAGTTEKTWNTHGVVTDEHLALERNGQFYYYHADGLGSVTAISDQNRAIVQTYGYDSFGMGKASTNFRNGYTYTGREWDKETGLLRMDYRYYDPMEGRFISKDPISFAGGDVSLYGYVQNNPINWTDPSGLEPVTSGLPDHVNPRGGHDASGLLDGIRDNLNEYKQRNADAAAERAIDEQERRMDCGTTRNYLVLFGTSPIRFIGLAPVEEASFRPPDTRTRLRMLTGIKNCECR